VNSLSADCLLNFPPLTDACKTGRLYLDNNALIGSLPSSLKELTALVELNLSNNKLTGSIPSSLDALTTLEQLLLERNELDGELPDTLWNKIGGSLPSALGNLRDLGKSAPVLIFF